MSTVSDLEWLLRAVQEERSHRQVAGLALTLPDARPDQLDQLEAQLGGQLELARLRAELANLDQEARSRWTDPEYVLPMLTDDELWRQIYECRKRIAELVEEPLMDALKELR